MQPGAQRIYHHAFDHDVGARRDQRGDHREGGRGRIGGNDDRIGPQFGAALERDLAPGLAFRRDFDLGAEMAQHFLGMVARGLGLDHRRRARRVESGEQHRRFDLRRGDWRAIDDRRRFARAAQHDRAAAAFGLRQRPARPSARADRGCGASGACAERRRRRKSPSRHGRRRRPSSVARRCRHCRNRADAAAPAATPTPIPATRQRPRRAARSARREPCRPRRCASRRRLRAGRRFR